MKKHSVITRLCLYEIKTYYPLQNFILLHQQPFLQRRNQEVEKLRLLNEEFLTYKVQELINILKDLPCFGAP